MDQHEDVEDKKQEIRRLLLSLLDAHSALQQLGYLSAAMHVRMATDELSQMLGDCSKT